MQRRTVVVLLVGLLLCLTLGLYAPSASAHNSTCCGHGHSGIVIHTHYKHSHWEGSTHFHVYGHYHINHGRHVHDHDQQKVCPGH